MTTFNSTHMVGGFLALLLAAAAPADAPDWQVSTLSSPNEERDSHFGNDVAGAGDVNRDGFDDTIVGARQEADSAGRAYVFGGPNGTLLFQLASPNAQSHGLFGDSVGGVGDVNQDGFADLIVGAKGEEQPGGGRAYLFSGMDGSLLLELASPNPEPGGSFAESVAGAGDVDRDGYADLIVGASSEDPDLSPEGAGRAYVFSGKDGSVIFELASPNEEEFGYFGISVAAAGDVNRDRFADTLVGTLYEDPGTSPHDAGRAYVFSGQDGSVLFELASPNEEADGHFGASVAGAGDVNQDGAADLLVGAPYEDSSGSFPRGRAYLLSGQNGSLLVELASPNEGDGFAAFGAAVAGSGDIDGDGSPDVIVGDESLNGRAYLFGGRNGSLLFELVSPNEQLDGAFGYAVAGAGDVNQDGHPDVIVGAPSEDPDDSPPGAGRAYVFLSGGALQINSGGPNYTDTNGSMFVADRAYVPGGFGYVGGLEHTFNQPIGGTDDDPLYQDVRIAREGNSDGIFAYRFDVASPARYDVTLYLMAPALDGAGNVVMDVQAEEDLAFDDLDITAEAGGEYQALVKTFAVDVNDGTLDLRFRAVNKAALVSAIAVAAQTEARGSTVARRPVRSER